MVPLVIVGNAVQAGGFVLALREAIKTRRGEVPEHPPLHTEGAAAISRRVVRILVWSKLRKPTPVVAQLAGSIGMKTEMRGRLSFRRGGLSTEERFDALEDEVQRHRAEQADENRQLERKIEGVEESVEAVSTQLENDRKQRLVRALRSEEAGVYLFILGLAISTAGALS